MTTVVLGDRPPELEAMVKRRRKLGLDTHDEVWEGDYHMAPGPHLNHGLVQLRLGRILADLVEPQGLEISAEFNLGIPDDYRVPDLGIHAELKGQLYVPTALAVVEVLSPYDETFAKFEFYARRDVREILVADPDARTVRCWDLTEDPRQVLFSSIAQVAVSQLQDDVRWP